MSLILHIIPKHVFAYNFQGSYKDVIGRINFFENRKYSYIKAVTGDDPLQLEAILKDRRPTHILIEYSHHVKILRHLRAKYPEAFIAVRSHNIEPLQLIGRSSVTLRGMPKLLYGAIRMLYIEALCRQKADVIYSINEWEIKNYWDHLPGKAEVKWLPYFAPDFMINQQRPEKKQNVIACTLGGIGSPRQKDLLRKFIAFARVAKQDSPHYSFVITGNTVGCGMGIPEFIGLPGMIEDMGAFLRNIKAIAVLSPIGFGFKTSISDALANGCCCLLHPDVHKRLPAVLQAVCLKVDPLERPSVIRALDSIDQQLNAPDIDKYLRGRALRMLRDDFAEKSMTGHIHEQPIEKKRILGRATLAEALYHAGLWRIYNSSAQIIYYHRIVEKKRGHLFKDGTLELDLFLEQVDFLMRYKKVIGLNELLSEHASGRPLDKRYVALCFDDALSCVYRNVLPELSARKIPFAVGVAAALPDTGRSLWEYEAAFLVSQLYERGLLKALFERLREAHYQVGPGSLAGEKEAFSIRPEELPGPIEAISRVKKYLRKEVSSEQRYPLLDHLIAFLQPDLREILAKDDEFRVMTWKEIREVAGAGGDIASHGYWHHLHNETLTEQSRQMEFSASKASIFENIGQDVNAFIWPEGVTSKRSREAALASGYKFLLSTREAFISSGTPLYDIPRNMGEWPLAQMLWNTRNLP